MASLQTLRIALLAGLLMLAAGLACLGCKKSRDQAEKASAEPSRSAPQQAEKEPADEPPEDAVARIGERTISTAEFEAELARFDRQQKLTAVQRRNLERKALDHLVRRTLVELAAEDAGIALTDPEIDAAWEQEVKRLGGPEQLATYLEKERFTTETYRTFLAGNLLRARLRDLFYDEPISDEAVVNYYNNYKDHPGRGEKAKVSRILFRLDSAAHASVWQKAEEKMAAVKAEIEAGLPFAEAARKYSEGPYGKRGGDLGWGGANRRPLDTFGPALKLQPGELYGPTRMKLGVQLITVTDRKNDAVGTLEQEKDRIRAILEDQRDVRNDRRLFDRLRATYRVDYLR